MDYRDREGFLSINGIRHWYRVAGAAMNTTPIVIVHGGPGGNVYSFERTIGPLLETLATVLYYEQRGSGRSDPPADPDDYSLPVLAADLDRLRRSLGIERMHLLGFSFGAELAACYSLKYPEAVERLILQSPSIAPPGRIAKAQVDGFTQVAEDEIAQAIHSIRLQTNDVEEQCSRIWSIVDRATVDRFLFVDPVHAARNRTLWNESGLTNTGDMARALAKQEHGNLLFGRLPLLTLPVLVIAGAFDRNIGLDTARNVARAIPNANLTVMETSAHFPDIEQSGIYASAVATFLG